MYENYTHTLPLFDKINCDMLYICTYIYIGTTIILFVVIYSGVKYFCDFFYKFSFEIVVIICVIIIIIAVVVFVVGQTCFIVNFYFMCVYYSFKRCHSLLQS